MRDQQHHQELFRKVNMYLDNEVPHEAKHELLREIKSNPASLEMLSKERNFREFIRERASCRKVSPDLIQSIKEKIRIAPA